MKEYFSTYVRRCDYCKCCGRELVEFVQYTRHSETTGEIIETIGKKCPIGWADYLKTIFDGPSHFNSNFM